jgi:pilus assembly protein Flp/PilA
MTMQTGWLRFPDSAKRLLRDESATTAIEYALIASLISTAILLAAMSVGTSLSDNAFDRVTNAFNDILP